MSSTCVANPGMTTTSIGPLPPRQYAMFSPPASAYRVLGLSTVATVGRVGLVALCRTTPTPSGLLTRTDRSPPASAATGIPAHRTGTLALRHSCRRRARSISRSEVGHPLGRAPAGNPDRLGKTSRSDGTKHRVGGASRVPIARSGALSLARAGGWVSAAGAGEERGHDVGGVPVERDSRPVVAHGGPGVGVAGGLLHIA
jgi:hypothetical protein